MRIFVRVNKKNKKYKEKHNMSGFTLHINGLMFDKRSGISPFHKSLICAFLPCGGAEGCSQDGYLSEISNVGMQCH
jgi:hypothetical protein